MLFGNSSGGPQGTVPPGQGLIELPKAIGPKLGLQRRGAQAGVSWSPAVKLSAIAMRNDGSTGKPIAIQCIDRVKVFDAFVAGIQVWPDLRSRAGLFQFHGPAAGPGQAGGAHRGARSLHPLVQPGLQRGGGAHLQPAPPRHAEFHQQGTVRRFPTDLDAGRSERPAPRKPDLEIPLDRQQRAGTARGNLPQTRPRDREPTRSLKVMPVPERTRRRVTVDGRFFQLDGQNLSLMGVTYGPFAPDAEGGTFANLEQTARDFQQIRDLGANLLRVYYPPPRWWLELAAEQELKVLIDVPWAKHLCFLDSAQSRAEARRAVRETVAACKGLPAVFAYSVGNEIPAEIVRWSGAARVEQFIDELVEEAKSIDPESLCTFTSFPPTEYLHPQLIDFVCFNVYLHQRAAFENYLARLQMLAESKPPVLGEFAMESLREVEACRFDFLAWQLDLASRPG